MQIQVKKNNELSVFFGAEDNNPKEVTYITGEEYIIPVDEKISKNYPLRGYKIKCKVENGKAIPLLREARGREKNLYKKWIYPERGYKYLEGPENNLWPIIEEI